jgi:ABC-type bacteriocin/lantibiotic exporter with double-glycine peptidase domain
LRADLVEPTFFNPEEALCRPWPKAAEHKTKQKRQSFGLMKGLTPYFRPFKSLIALGSVCIVVSLALSLVQPLITMWIVDRALVAKNVRLLNLLGAAFLVIAVLSCSGGGTQNWCDCAWGLKMCNCGNGLVLGAKAAEDQN